MKKNHGCGVKNTQLGEANLNVINTQKPNAQSQSFYIIQQKSKDLECKWNVWLLQAKSGQKLMSMWVATNASRRWWTSNVVTTVSRMKDYVPFVLFCIHVVSSFYCNVCLFFVGTSLTMEFQTYYAHFFKFELLGNGRILDLWCMFLLSCQFNILVFVTLRH